MQHDVLRMFSQVKASSLHPWPSVHPGYTSLGFPRPATAALHSQRQRGGHDLIESLVSARGHWRIRPVREETIAALDRSVCDLGPLEARRLL